MATKKIVQQKATPARKKPKSVSRTSKVNTKNYRQEPFRETTKVSYQKNRFGDSVLEEVVLLLVIGAAIIVLISLFTAKMGALGHGISLFLKGMFGFGAYVLPILVLLYCAWTLVAKEKKWTSLKIAGGLLFLVSVCIFFHALKGQQPAGGFWKKITFFYQNGGGINGGVLGGILGGGLVRAFNRPVTYLLAFVLFLASLILATGKSFFTALGQFLIWIGAVPQYKREKRKMKHRQIQYEEPIKESRILKKQEHTQEKKGRRQKQYRNSFDIQLAEEEGYHESQKKAPVIETFDFDKKKKKTAESKQNDIYDFCKEADLTIPEELPDVEEIRDDVQDVLEELDQKTEMPFLKQKEQWREENPLLEGFLEPDQQELAKAAVKSTLVPLEAVQKQIQTEPRFQRKTNLPKPVQTELFLEQQEQKQEKREEAEYQFPPLELLGQNSNPSSSGSKAELLNNAKKLEDTLKSFGVNAKVIQINKGPTVTRYELSPSQGVKVSKIVNLADDIALNLAASGIRIEAPIPGKAAVGIEVPNQETQSVYLRDVIQSEAFQKFPSKLAFALGQDISGNPVVTDIAKMPHLLIAGATGSGKSVCINTLITSILYKADPKEVKLILVDPKVVELSVYNGIPHLLIPVVTDPKKAAGALNWAVREMLTRYQNFAEQNVRDIKGYNAKKKEQNQEDFMPQIVIIIDELADLMMAAAGEVEDAICRLAQMARASGLHLIIATQRPSVDVITGLIKANIPSRLAFAVSSGTDSRTILDSTGAEKLLGKGDMLFYPVGRSKPVRLQGAFVTDKEVEQIVSFVRVDRSIQKDQEMMEKITANTKNTDNTVEDVDEFLDQAIAFVVRKEKASVSMLQRQFRIGYNRAARMMETLENRGIVGPEDGSKPRKVLMSLEEMEKYQENGGEF